MNKLLARIILFTELKEGNNYTDNISYFFKALVQLAPIAFVLNWFNVWFIENKQFFFFTCLMLVLNLVIGIWYHIRLRSFSWSDFWKKNLSMCATITVTYFVLEMFRYTAGDNLAGDIFRVTIQLSTLLYPGSKILKNVYVLSNKEYPPKFVMQRLYRFEKSGNPHDLVNDIKQDDTEVKAGADIDA